MHKEEKGKGKQKSSRTLLDALASAIDGTNGEEVTRLAAEFNNSFGHLVRASIEAESAQGDEERDSRGETNVNPTAKCSQTPKMPSKCKSRDRKREPTREDITKETVGEKTRDEGDTLPSSSEESDVKKPQKKKKKRNASKKKQSNHSDSSPDSDPSSDSSSSGDDSSDDSSLEQEAELCYEITEFESADLPDLPEKWDKGFRKLRSYVPLTLFNTALLESFYDDDGETESVNKSTKSKSSLKVL